MNQNNKLMFMLVAKKKIIILYFRSKINIYIV